MTTITTTLHYYRFDIKNAEERILYNKMCEDLQAQGLKVFDSISSDHGKFYNDSIAPLNGKKITLETEHLFNNQWNTAPIKKGESGLRVFDWSEAIYSNIHLKQGMFLDQTEEMKAVRQNTYKCGYCGTNYYMPKISFCNSNSCLGSEYLTEDQLPLLFLQPIANEDRHSKKSIVVPDSIVKEMQEKQLITRTNKLENAKADKLARLKKDIANTQKEFEAFQWLINHNIDFENVIFYDHTDTFCFGWRNALPKDEALKLEKTLSEGFTKLYKVEIKKV